METNELINEKSDITKTEAEALRRQIKSMIVAKGYTIEKLANELKEKYNTKESKSNLSNKLMRGSLRFIDVQRIASILGYTIELKNLDRATFDSSNS